MTRFHCVRQRDATDCAAACLATVCRQYGVDQPLGRIRVAAGTDKMGTSAYGLIRAAQHLGFAARGVRGTLDALVSPANSANLPLPAVAHVTSEDGLLHFVVIQRIWRQMITVSDPARGVRTMPAAEFARRWSGTLILLTPGADGLAPTPRVDSTARRLAALLCGQGHLLALITAASVLVTAIGIAAAFYFQVIIDDVVPGALWQTLTTVSVAVVALYVVKALLDAARYHLVLHVQRSIDMPLVLGYFNHVIGLPMSFYGTRRVGDIVTRFEDASRIREALAGATVTVFVDVLMSIGGCVVLAVQDTTLFAIAAAVAGLHGILGLVSLRPVQQLNEAMMEANAGVTSHFVESITGAETVKAYNAQTHVRSRADSLYVSYLRKVFRYGEWQNAQLVIGDALGTLGTAVILWVGAMRVLDGQMTVGELVVFSTLLNYFLDPVRNLMGLQPELQSAATAARRLSDVLVLEAERLDAEGQVPLGSIDRPIVVQNVHFAYGSRRPVLADLSLTIPPGMAVALVGESGSGKTTVAKLLMKFYAPTSGTIRFGDLDIQDVSARSLRHRIAYIAQDTAFFSGTVADNLRLARPDAAPEHMIWACRMAQAHGFIMALPGRYQGLLDEDAANLSGGQRQRLAIARALLRRADMLILDEATSNMDSVSERAVSDTIRRLGGITRLIIAHRLSTVVACDIIYVMSGGTVVEAGTHEELLALGGTYWGLWQAQYSLELESTGVPRAARRSP